MTTLETAPGLKGVGISISPVLGTLSTPGFRRREALEECRRLSTCTYTKLHFWMRVLLYRQYYHKKHCGRCFLTVVVVVTVKRLEKTFEKSGSPLWMGLLMQIGYDTELIRRSRYGHEVGPITRLLLYPISIV